MITENETVDTNPNNAEAERIITQMQNDAQSAKFEPTDEVQYVAGKKAGESMVDVENTNETEDDMIIGRVYKKDYASLKDDIEKIVAAKIAQKINQKKQEFLNNVRGNL